MKQNITSFDTFFERLQSQTMEELLPSESYVRAEGNSVFRDNDSLDFLESICKKVLEKETDLILSTEKHCYAVLIEIRKNPYGEELPEETIFRFDRVRKIY